ncbi:MAG TPA: sugar isomerase [Phycisphaerae bacterium]|nr:sugar isomerase [Phycisphaerae bacterium]
MNPNDDKYTRFALCREMMQAVEVFRRFHPGRTKDLAAAVAGVGRLMLTGEGSSRTFPAKNAVRKAMAWGLDLQVATDGSRQAATYDLSRFATFAASNSGRTNEVVLLMQALQAAGVRHRYGLTANAGTPLESYAAETFVLDCGAEEAFAATKTAVEQALFYQSIVSHAAGRDMAADLAGLDAKFAAVLSQPIPTDVVRAGARAGMIYFVGYNDGVAEELTLKAAEVTRTKAEFLEGSAVLHGAQEVMDSGDVVFIVEPVADDLPKLAAELVGGVGLTAVAIAAHPTELPTIQVPDAGEMNPYVLLAAGWNALVEIGLAAGIDLDKPIRAKKVGSEFVGADEPDHQAEARADARGRRSP